MLWAAGLAFVAYALATSVGAEPAAYLLTSVGAFLLGYWRQQPWLWWVFTLVLSVNIAIALSVPTMPHGIWGNPNYFGVALAIGLAGAIAYRIWYFIPMAALGLYTMQSRTALLGAAMASFLGVYRRFPATACVLALGCIFAAVLVTKGDGSLSQRLGIWQVTLNHLTLWGHGWGGFQDAFMAIPVKINATNTLVTHAYNDWLEMVFMLGLGAIPLMVFLAICAEGTSPEGRLIFATYVAMSFTYFPLWVPGVAPLVAMALGHMAASRLERKPSWLDGDLLNRTI